jgi:hypothetical protein
MKEILQHGDVILKRIDKIPESMKKIAPKGNIILAEGEVTGHAHRIKEINKAELFENNGLFMLKVNDPVDLVHEEHKTITIQPGSYEIDRVKEYDPFEEEIRRVQD